MKVVGLLLAGGQSRRMGGGDKALRLPPKEYTLLEFFLLNPERVVTRTELLEKVWNLHFDPGSNVVDTHVARLRAKLHRYGVTASIVTVRGEGFVLRREGKAE